ncbi:MAG: DNA mismatch endonuclease Vsr [Pseudomonadota bacterium]
MADTLSKEHRSWLMSRVPRFDSKPEIVVRKLAHALGYRFRLHRKDLPGRPDIVFPRLRKVIFVHGCFWHRHDCKKATTPKSNTRFWIEKFENNVKRDQKALNDLKDLGWGTMVVWECEIKNVERLVDRVSSFLGDNR